MLIALWENHHASGVALKVLATWAGAVNDSDPCANFYTHSKWRSSITAKALRKWRLSPLLSPCSRPRSTWFVAGVAAVATTAYIPNEKIRTYAEMTLLSIKIAGSYWRVKASVVLIKFENWEVERGGFEKKRVNPPIGAIKDRLIGGFGGKSKSHVNYRLRHQSGLIEK